MKRTIKAQRAATAHVPESSIKYIMIREVEERIGSAGKVDDLNLIWRAERFLGVPTGTDRAWMKATALNVLRSCRLVCCGDEWWRKRIRGRDLREMTPDEHRAEYAQALIGMIEAGRRNPDTATMARVSLWAVEGIAPGTHIYKIHIQIDPGDSRRSWGYCEDTPFYNVPHDPTPGADFCLPLSEAVRRFVAKPSLPFLGLIGFRVVCGIEGDALFRRSVRWHAEILEGAGRHDLAADLRAVKVEAVTGGAA